MWRLQVVYVACLIVMFRRGHRVMAESYYDRTGLRDSLLTGYKTDVRPLINQTQPININMTSVLYKILSVDAVRGTMTIVVSFRCTWYDELITWTPSDHNDTQTLKIYKSDVWIPHITLGNPVEFAVFDSYFMQVTYSYTGLAFYHCGNVVEMMCEFNVMFWPFDIQVCDLQVFAYDMYSQDLEFVQLEYDLSSLRENAEWTLESVKPYATSLQGLSSANFKLTLMRQSTFYVFQILLPLLGIATLNPLVFLLPSQSGERVSYSTTILLSITVFLTIIGDSIPKTSKPLPLLVILLALVMMLGLATSPLVIANLYIYHKTDTKGPNSPIVRRLVKTVTRLSCKKRAHSKVRPMKIDVTSERKTSKPQNTLFTTMSTGTSANEMNLNISAKDEKTRNRKPKASETGSGGDAHDSYDPDDITWKDVSYTIDKVAFISMMGMHVAVCSSMVLFMAIASKQ